MKKDKAKVIDDVWTEDHIRSFLSARPHDNSDQNFHMLLKSYQSMRAEDFKLFVDFFCAEDRPLNATGLDGRSVLDIVLEHRRGTDYAAILRAAGATQ
jgi:hypothetical protein